MHVNDRPVKHILSRLSALARPGDLQAKSDTGESCGGEVGFMGGAALEKATVDGVDGVFQLRDA